MALPRTRANRRKYFKNKYETDWVSFQHNLSELEKVTLDLYFGISDEALTYSKISERLNLTNDRHARRIIQHALNKLRKAATKTEKEKSRDE